MHQAQVTRDDAGYAMAALLVAMALMAVMMSVAMPVWRQAAQREKEAELIWRGQQYDRAIQLFRRKASAPGAPNLDILIQQKFLRKKYKDPITGGDFELKPVGVIGPGTQMPGGPGQGNARPGIGNRSSGFGSQTPALGNQSGSGTPGGAGGAGSGQRGRERVVGLSDSAVRGAGSAGDGWPAGHGSADRRRAQQEQGALDQGAERADALRSVGVRLRALQSQPAAPRHRRHRSRTAAAHAGAAAAWQHANTRDRARRGRACQGPTPP